MKNLTYKLGNSLYINLTNKCSNACTFCVRNLTDEMGGVNLRLEHDPDPEEVFASLTNLNFDDYDEVVFCGYGEPTESLRLLLYVARYIRATSKTPIRLNTNGCGDIINKTSTAPLLEGLIDTVSISLNAADSLGYVELCRPIYGEAAYVSMLNFAIACRKHIPKVILTVVNVISSEEIEKCREIAQKLNVDFRVRNYS